MQVGSTGRAGQRERQHARGPIIPARLVQTATVPGDLRQAPLARRATEEAPALQRRVHATQGDHALEEAQQLALALAEIPREPADRVILAVDVIVPALT